MFKSGYETAYTTLRHLDAGYQPLYELVLPAFRSRPEQKVVSAVPLNAHWTSTYSNTSCVKLGHKIILVMDLGSDAV